jgi:RNA ligase (TIGR02306 family)
MRKLATIKVIDAIHPIEGADAIEVAQIGGWKVVVKKNEYQPGDHAIYCEIDSWIPHELAPFLSKGREPREYNGVKGERLNTVKLRGQISQGLLLPLTDDILSKITDCDEDISPLLNIQKWEAPIPAQLAGEVRGMFPRFIPKTDEERIQNLTLEVEEWSKQKISWEITEKLDGSSMTVYVFQDDCGVCSRNLNLKETEGNTLWKIARSEQLIEKIKSTGKNLALQGELIGEGIQGNPYKIKGHQFRVFNIYDIDLGIYVSPSVRMNYVNSLQLNSVPVVAQAWEGVLVIDDLLQVAEDKSVLNATTEREGVVFKCNDLPNTSFKVISNKFLLKG